MKKTALLTAGFITTAARAQADSTNVLAKKNEFKIGAIKLLAGPIVDVTYERIHSQYFTYGVSLLGNLNSKKDQYPEDFSVTPFARMYFSEPKYYGGRGFFVEGFAKFIAGHDDSSQYESFYSEGGVYYSNYIEDRHAYTAGSAGIALGWKWINKAGFVFEILAGGGRNFGGNGYMPDANFRGDFNLGYRF